MKKCFVAILFLSILPPYAFASRSACFDMGEGYRCQYTAEPYTKKIAVPFPPPEFALEWSNMVLFGYELSYFLSGAIHEKVKRNDHWVFSNPCIFNLVAIDSGTEWHCDSRYRVSATLLDVTRDEISPTMEKITVLVTVQNAENITYEETFEFLESKP